MLSSSSPTLLLACGGLAFTSSKKVASYSARRPEPWLGRNWSAYTVVGLSSLPRRIRRTQVGKEGTRRNITTVIYWILLPKGDLGLFVGRCRLLLGLSRAPPPTSLILLARDYDDDATAFLPPRSPLRINGDCPWGEEEGGRLCRMTKKGGGGAPPPLAGPFAR